MGSGIRAEVKVDASGSCPITTAAQEMGSPIVSISTGVNPEAPAEVTEEFMVDPDGDQSVSDYDEEFTQVFTYGRKQVYRFERPRRQDCPCDLVETFDVPVVDVHTRDGTLYLVFHAVDIEQLRAVVDALHEQFPNVDVQRLLHSTDDRDDNDLVFLDRGELTERQREVIETASEMGYFEHPKGANAGEVAAELGISPSTFTEHLAAAQTKLHEAILEN